MKPRYRRDSTVFLPPARANDGDPLHYLRFMLRRMARFHETEMPGDTLLPLPAVRIYAATIGILWALKMAAYKRVAPPLIADRFVDRLPTERARKFRPVLI